MAKTKKTRPLTLREDMFVELLPAMDWIVYKAGIAAGFTETYARKGLTKRILTNMPLKTAVDKKKAEIQGLTDLTKQQARAKYETVLGLALKKQDLTNANSAIRGEARLYGLEIEHIEHDHFLGRMPDAEGAIERSKARVKQVESKEVGGPAQAEQANTPECDTIEQPLRASNEGSK